MGVRGAPELAEVYGRGGAGHLWYCGSLEAYLCFGMLIDASDPYCQR